MALSLTCFSEYLVAVHTLSQLQLIAQLTSTSTTQDPVRFSSRRGVIADGVQVCPSPLQQHRRPRPRSRQIFKVSVLLCSIIFFLIYYCHVRQTCWLPWRHTIYNSHSRSAVSCVIWSSEKAEYLGVVRLCETSFYMYIYFNCSTSRRASLLECWRLWSAGDTQSFPPTDNKMLMNSSYTWSTWWRWVKPVDGWKNVFTYPHVH